MTRSLVTIFNEKALCGLGREVQTTGATSFLTPCATLANGQTVSIKGKQTGNGKVIAREVK